MLKERRSGVAMCVFEKIGKCGVPGTKSLPEPPKKLDAIEQM